MNIGVDPPDVVKPNPCARLQCWQQPNPDHPGESVQSIAATLKSQYDRWSDRDNRLKIATDTNVTELNRLCVAVRRHVGDQRLLFHYNGHGVPRPTANGEIWVFNTHFSQYIPFSLFDLNNLLKSPVLYIFDCNSAGTLLEHYKNLHNQLEDEWQDLRRQSARYDLPPAHHNSVFLASCAKSELLPMAPYVPADLFTSCLTTPVRTALQWFARRTIIPNITPAMLDRIPGKLHLRNTPLGELEYILTAVTDAIAWNSFPRELFKSLYRQDLFLASMMRHFLLAQRIMRSFGCTPQSHPELPATHNHHLWKSFDLAMENLFSKLPAMISEEEANNRPLATETSVESDGSRTPSRSTPPVAHDQRPSLPRRLSMRKFPPPPSTFSRGEDPAPSDDQIRASFNRQISFFEAQMRALDVWLDMGPDHRLPPEQLPVLLQVLPSPTLRVQALQLLSRYLQTGRAAVDEALAVGIFPYVARLLKDPDPHIQNDLVFIWSKILALDDSCRTKIMDDNTEGFFVSYLRSKSAEEKPEPVYLACAMFVISVLARGCPERFESIAAIDACLAHLSAQNSFVRRWCCLCMAEVLRPLKDSAQLHLLGRLDLIEELRCCAIKDESPDVRAAAISTLASIMNGVLRVREIQDSSDEQADQSMKPQTCQTTSPACSMLLDSASSASERFQAQDRPNRRAHQPVVQDETVLDENELLDAIVPSYSVSESDALLKIGGLLPDIFRKESSVLVRREIADAINRTATVQKERFIRAALITELQDSNISRSGDRSKRTTACEKVYCSLWQSLSELAFDPHPVVARIARFSFDKIYALVSERTAPYRSDHSLQDDVPATDDLFSPAGSPVEDFVLPNTKGVDTSEIDLSSAVTPDGTTPAPIHDLPNDEIGRGHRPLLGHGDESDGTSRDSNTSQSLFLHGSSYRERIGNIASSLVHGMDNIESPSRFVAGTVHVRSDSGAFDLNTSARLLKYANKNLITIAPSSFDACTVPRRNLITPEATESVDETKSEPCGEAAVENGRPSSLPQMHLPHYVGNFMKTISQRFRKDEIKTMRLPTSASIHSGLRVNEMGNNEVRATSPPRPPRRSLSYQVLNEASSFSPKNDGPLFPPTRPTSYVPFTAKLGTSDGSRSRQSDKLPQGYSQLGRSESGNAALSLYEWSASYISRAEVEASSLDDSGEAEAIPRYATLWSNITKRSQNSVADSLRAFALLGKGDDVIGMEAEGLDENPIVDGNNVFHTARELSLHVMGAGGGSVSALTFLPRDTGIGDDQLIATGDSHGSVGVYNARTGKCQGAFGIPVPPGMREEGVSSILCLNPNNSDGESSVRLSSSQSALILAGSFDGRVAVFKNDFSRPSDFRIMSTFQASGSTTGWKRKFSTLSKTDSHNLLTSSESDWYLNQASPSYIGALRRRGKGLVLAYSTQSSRLAAAGLDDDIVRVWDLSMERCIWEGQSVEQGSWPTALTMWNTGNANVFVTGSSSGSINLIDMREDIKRDRFRGHLLGRHKEPVIAAGTCPPLNNGQGGGVVVSADYGADIAFWDTRWRNDCSKGSIWESQDNRRIAAHGSNLTAMSVHRSGQFVASGSLNGVKIFGRDGNMMKMTSHHQSSLDDGVMKVSNGDRLAPVTSLSFQHESCLLAIGFLDGSVMIYGRHRDLFPGIGS